MLGMEQKSALPWVRGFCGGNIMARRNVNMLEGSIYKGILSMTIPILMMNVLQSLFNIIDMTVLKNFGSNEATVGAVGVSGTLISVTTALGVGIASGSAVVVARYIGKGDPKRVQRSMGTAFFMVTVIGLLIALLGLFGSRALLRMINCSEALLDEAARYLCLYFVGVPISLIASAAHAVMRAAGDARRTRNQVVAAGALKVILSVVFVVFFNLSVVGVALATILSWVLSAGLGILSLRRGYGTTRLYYSNIRPFGTEIREVMFIGIPEGLQKALYSVANLIITATVNTFGPNATTGCSIANNFDGLMYQVACAASFAVVPYVSQNIGAGNLQRAKRAIVTGTVITVAMGVTFGGLSGIFSASLSSIMSSNPDVIAYSVQKMMLISPTYFICGINEVLGGALRGMGRPMHATVAALVYMCGIRFVWVYLVFPALPQNLTFLYLIWPIGWVLSSLTLLVALLFRLRSLKRELGEQPTAAAA